MNTMLQFIAIVSWLTAAWCAFISIRKILRFRRSPSLPCPGPSTWWHDWILPWSWTSSSQCGYDLRGLAPLQPTNEPSTDTVSPVSHPVPIQCPECGGHTHIDRRRLILRASNRPIAFTTLLILAAILATHIAWIRNDAWIRMAPTALLAHAATYGKLTPESVYDELSDRARKDNKESWQYDSLIKSAISNLHDDALHFNAEWAFDVLTSAGERAVPRLERELNSPDYQVRQFAASLLILHWDHSRPGSRYAHTYETPYLPPDLLIKAAIEALKSDNISFVHANAADSMEFLSQIDRDVAPDVEQSLAPSLDSSDPQERFLSALILGLRGASAHAPKAAPILAEHLKHNSITNDAAPAARALYLLGPACLPALEPLLTSLDTQAASAALLIRLNILTPGEPLEKRKALNSITKLCHDPTLELTRRQIREMIRHAL
jgi:hypothetical protein